MPELPEVETVRRGLAEALGGVRVRHVEVSGARTVRRQPVEELVARLGGARVEGVRRRGKYLLVPLDTAEVLVVHLRMSGQLRLARGPAEARPPHTRAVLTLDDGRELRFVDPRTFGELFVSVPAGRRRLPPELAGLGPDALDELRTPGQLRAVLGRSRRRLKDVLTDQRAIAGLGSIYADEALHAAGLRFDRRADTVSGDEVATLRRAVRTTLLAAIRAGGSTLGDGQYVDPVGRPGRYQQRHRVYGRAGQACRRCGTPVERARWSGRSAYFCPTCQR
ncbi:MAG: bifunctional DNA-formamidopyrimidine glycosylase/DNA-(apurinic or apyrimidinic site) lyase [Acidimicrobiales bacterium]|nr:bifunctional DNA-formamidopyrimidine glycosylase/DNA-(apurinic or apyrimidinic site) lyase [Acidimicrobiales bacterium]